MAATPLRLLVTEPLDGVTNMATDEALLRARITGLGGPTVRFYGWTAPTVSVGYGQVLDEAVDAEACRRAGVPLVRRPTGGGAILHEPPHRELTYAVVALGRDFAGADDVLETYRLIGQALADGFGRLGVPAELAPRVRGRAGEPASGFCFVRTGSFEITVGGRKLVGSAQRRQGGAFLQHGTILLDADLDRLRALFTDGDDPGAGLTTLARLRGAPVDRDAVVAALTAALAEALAAPLVPGRLSTPETALVRHLVVHKYATAGWTERAEAHVPGDPVPARQAVC